MKIGRHVQSLAVAGLLAGLAAFPAHAAPLFTIDSGLLTPGDSKSNAISASNPTSSLGAAASVDFTFSALTGSTGLFSVALKNTGLGVLDAFGFDVNNAKGFLQTGFSENTALCSVNGCTFSSPASNNQLSGFLANIDLSASASTAHAGAAGLAHGEQVTLVWDVDFTAGTITSGESFNDLISKTLITDNAGGTFSSFWDAHVIQLADGASDKIGGAVATSNVPEPASLGLFGAGLIGLAALRRRKRRIAA